MAEDGDWVEGVPKLVWKYVFPSQETFYLTVLTSTLATTIEPEPDRQTWRQRVTGEVLEGLVMLHAAIRAGEVDGERLRSEAVERIYHAVARIQRAELEQR